MEKGGARIVTEEYTDGRENGEISGTEEEDLENLTVKVLAESGIRVREEDEQELEREAETVKQENDKQDEEEPHREEDKITLPGIAEEESITEQEREDGVDIQEKNGGVEPQVLTRERVGRNSTRDA